MIGLPYIAGGFALVIAFGGIQTIRLQSAHATNRTLEQSLATCSARAANMELRRGIEDNTAAEPDPLGELRRSFTRPN